MAWFAAMSANSLARLNHWMNAHPDTTLRVERTLLLIAAVLVLTSL